MIGVLVGTHNTAVSQAMNQLVKFLTAETFAHNVKHVKVLAKAAGPKGGPLCVPCCVAHVSYNLCQKNEGACVKRL